MKILEYSLIFAFCETLDTLGLIWASDNYIKETIWEV